MKLEIKQFVELGEIRKLTWPDIKKIVDKGERKSKKEILSQIKEQFVKEGIRGKFDYERLIFDYLCFMRYPEEMAYSYKLELTSFCEWLIENGHEILESLKPEK